MPDRARVVKGLTLCSDEKHDCRGCPYFPGRDEKDYCIDRLERDALALLREQETTTEAVEDEAAEWERLKGGTGNG